MAFGFIKKVFSFGRKDEAPVPEQAPAPPAVEPADAARRRTAAAPGISADAMSRTRLPTPTRLTESPPDIVGRPGRCRPHPQPDLLPRRTRQKPAEDQAALPAATLEEFDLEAEEEPATSRRRRIEPPPSPVEPAPEHPAPIAAPSAEIAPPIRVPSPIETRPVEAEIAPEPHGDRTAAAGRRIAARPSNRRRAASARRCAVAEIAPPIRVPSPVEPRPVEAEIAPGTAGDRTATVRSDAQCRFDRIRSGAGVGHLRPPAPKEPAAGKVLVGKVIAPKVEQAEPVQPAERKSWFQRLRDGLSRSSRELTGGIAGIFTKRKLDEETLEELEEVLLRADLGMETAIRVTDALSASRYGKDVSDTEVRADHGAGGREGAAARRPAARTRPLAQAACHPGGGRQRHRQDHHHRQARRQADGRRPVGDAGGRRHVPRRRHRAAEDLGRAHRLAGRLLEDRRRRGRALPGTPSRRPRPPARTCSSSTPPAACRTAPS